MYDYSQIEQAVSFIRERDGRRPQLAAVLGSGLGSFADTLNERVAIPYSEIPHFPQSSVSGHAGNLVIGVLDGVTVVAMQGRVHGYEGYPIEAVVFPVRVMRMLGAETLLVTNASGGLNPDFSPGDLMAITDHLNFSGANPLIGPNDERLGVRFPDMTDVYAPSFVEIMSAVAREQGGALRRGVYVGVSGPSYETAAEVRMFRSVGGDAVGMSTVHEVIAAAHCGFRIAGLSCITNYATGIGMNPLCHAEVEQVAAETRDFFTRLLAAAIPALARA